MNQPTVPNLFILLPRTTQLATRFIDQGFYLKEQGRMTEGLFFEGAVPAFYEL